MAFIFDIVPLGMDVATPAPQPHPHQEHRGSPFPAGCPLLRLDFIYHVEAALHQLHFHFGEQGEVMGGRGGEGQGGR